MRYAGAGENKKTFELSNGLIAAGFGVRTAPEGRGVDAAAGLCSDACTTSSRAAGDSVARGRCRLLRLAAICLSGSTSSMIQNERTIVDANRSPWCTLRSVTGV